MSVVVRVCVKCKMCGFEENEWMDDCVDERGVISL